jgi:hypothetical protein
LKFSFRGAQTEVHFLKYFAENWQLQLKIKQFLFENNHNSGFEDIANFVPENSSKSPIMTYTRGADFSSKISAKFFHPSFSTQKCEEMGIFRGKVLINIFLKLSK